MTWTSQDLPSEFAYLSSDDVPPRIVEPTLRASDQQQVDWVEVCARLILLQKRFDRFCNAVHERVAELDRPPAVHLRADFRAGPGIGTAASA